MSVKNKKTNIDYLLRVGDSQFDSMLSAIESIENKAGILAGAVGVVFTILGAGVAAKVLSINQPFQFLALGLMGLSILLNVWVLKAKSFKRPPRIGKFFADWGGKDPLKFKSKLLEIYDKKLVKNRDRLKEKAERFNIALDTFLLGLLLLIISLFYV